MSDARAASSTAGAEPYVELLRWSFEGEVFGAAFLARMLEQGIHAEHRDEIEALHRLEEGTRRTLESLILRHEITVDEAAARQTAAEFAESVSLMSWHAFMAEAQKIAIESLPRFRALQVCGERDGHEHDLPALAQVVAHEEALEEFARLQRTGSSSESMVVVERHLVTSW